MGLTSYSFRVAIKDIFSDFRFLPLNAKAMKRFEHWKTYLLYGIVLCCLGVVSCSDENPDPQLDDNAIDTTDVGNPNENPGSNVDYDANQIHSKIVLQNANSKEGDIPPSSNFADLKIDKDTIFLVEGITNRIRILHPGKGFATGSTHFYLKVEGADKYYELKAVEEESNDSIAVLYMDFDPGDFELPFSFKIKFSPSTGIGTAPIGEVEKVVVIDKKGDHSCSPWSSGEEWEWLYTIIDGEIEIAPGFGRSTETHVTGCCMDGSFSVDCISNGFPESEWIKLKGNASYSIEYETLLFTPGGEIFGGMREFVQNLDPNPGNSDFCGGQLGYISNNSDHAFWGNYTYNPSNGRIQFANLESRLQQVDLGELGTYPVYDKMFISENFLYEMISCHFLMETASVEGSSIIRLFERRKAESEKWYD